MPNFARDGFVHRNVRVPMRDGITLATSLFLPEGDGPWPVVLVRTAYNRVPMNGAEFTRRGIAFAVQDVRGRYDSGGEWYPFLHEADDGEDTLDWLALQPWCNGRVGMFGASYLAATQFYAALTQHPALCALNPQFMAGDPWKRAYYCDGALSLGLTWSWLCFECSARTSEAAWMPLFDVAAVLRSLPVVDMDVASGAGEVPWYRDYIRNNRYGPHWEPLNVREHLDRVRVPMLLMGGWYDYYAGETCRNFAALGGEQHGHRMILGPWTHGLNPTSVLGEVDFGTNGRWPARKRRNGSSAPAAG
ncbi:MAG: CocE/NonD family hydrolase [Armatimonadetes bacterium]|nr:CocE/NonD family hydrolase [Armatimonadota bacterium]